MNHSFAGHIAGLVSCRCNTDCVVRAIGTWVAPCSIHSLCDTCPPHSQRTHSCLCPRTVHPCVSNTSERPEQNCWDPMPARDLGMTSLVLVNCACLLTNSGKNDDNDHDIHHTDHQSPESSDCALHRRVVIANPGVLPPHSGGFWTPCPGGVRGLAIQHGATLS